MGDFAANPYWRAVRKRVEAERDTVLAGVPPGSTVDPAALGLRYAMAVSRYNILLALEEDIADLIRKGDPVDDD